ncbi:MAG TPA: T9SS type A sorting domain-containing protein [Saprospiraceae bacterium]|nr:T9SS type A sorting domain-containing protein [Saprospiraceae bacterium]
MIPMLLWFLSLSAGWSISASGMPFSSDLAVPLQSCNRTTDSTILVSFYQATDGPNWLTKWDLAKPMTQWPGVTLGPNGCVHLINLSNNNLQGSIPGSLGGLMELRILYLFGNKLNGSIPVEMGNLTALEDLAIEDNQLSGPIPPELGSATALKYLSLAKNELNGPIPTALANLAELQVLNLSHNQLSGNIPGSLSLLDNLNILDLSHNDLNGSVPANIGLMSGLVEIYINHNQLSGELPSTFSNLTQLAHVWLNNNQFTGRVPDLRTAPLNSLRLEHNLFTEIPDYSTVTTWGGQLPFGLVIHNNQFTFEDLIPLRNIHRRYYFSFKPQNPVVMQSIYFIPEASNYIILTGVDPSLTENNYKWFKDTSIVYISNKNNYELLQVSEVDEGYYSGRITNPLILDFELEISRFRVIVYNPVRCNTPEAATSCQAAPEFCSTLEIHNYCGSLGQKDSTQTALICGDTTPTVTNARWLSFVAPADSIAFEIFPMNCNGIDADSVIYTGMQAAIWRSCGSSADSLLACESECQDSGFILSSASFEIGKRYKLMLNGCAGDICEYLVRVSAGKQSFELDEPGPIAGDQSFCPDTLDHIFSVDAIPGAVRYNWFINDTFYRATTDSLLALNAFRPGIFQLKVNASNFCDTTETSFIVFQVTPQLELTDTVIHRIKVDSAYQIEFTIRGGVPPYLVTKGRGKVDSLSGKFFSDTLVCRSAYEFEITDARGCQLSYIGYENCGCHSVAGTMPMDTLFVCEGQGFTAKFTGTEIQDPGDAGAYILFTDLLNPKTTILKTSGNGLFPFDPARFRFDVLYYISRIVGRTKAGGEINLDHPCLSISNFQPVIFKRKPLLSAGPDLRFCGMEGRLSCFGNFSSGLWKLVQGPSTANIINPASNETTVLVGSFGEYTFSFEATTGYCTNKDEIKLTFVENLQPNISGFLFVCPGQSTILDGGNYARYQWSTGDTTPTLEVRMAGTYCLTVTDPSQCSGTICVAVSNSSAPVPELQGPESLCSGDVEFLRLNQSYLHYRWNTGDSSSVLQIDTGGQYCVTVTANNGCKATDCLTIDAKARGYSFRTDTVCYGETFTLLNQNFDRPGQYPVPIRDASSNGCDSIIQLQLHWHPQIVLSDTTIIRDDGSGSGAVSVTVAGGKPPYRYQWSNGSRSPIITNLKAGTYVLFVTDDRDCKASFFIVVGTLIASNDARPNGTGVQIFPNPSEAGKTLSIRSLSAKDWIRMTIMDPQGRVIEQHLWRHPGELEVMEWRREWTSGLYLIHFVDDLGGTDTQKWIIANP